MPIVRGIEFPGDATPDEIQKFFVEQAAATAGPPVAPEIESYEQGGGTPDLPLESPGGPLGVADPMNFAPLLFGGSGAAIAAPRAARAAAGMTAAVGKGLGRRVMGKGNFDDMVRDVLASIRGKAKVAGSIGKAKKVSNSETRRAASPSRGEPVPIKVPGKPGAVRGAAQRGAGPSKIARRGKEQARVARTLNPDNLEDLLRQTVEVEQHMNRLGFSPAERNLLRSALAKELRDVAR